MAIPTFAPNPAPSIGTSLKPQFRLSKSEFGDGYTQVTRDGLNHSRDTLSLNWELLTPAQGIALRMFFRERGGDLPFWYQSALHATPHKWTCEDFSPKIITGGLWSFSATLVESFTLQK